MGIKACNTRVLIDEFDFSGDTQGVTLSLTAAALEANTLQTCARKYIAGMTGGSIEQKGYWLGHEAGDIESEIYDRLGAATPVIVSVLFDTRALGNPAYMMVAAAESKLTTDAPIDGLLTLAATWDGVTQRGLAVAHQTFAGTTAAAGVDFGTPGVDGGWAALHVRAIVGAASNATFVVESDDNSGRLRLNLKVELEWADARLRYLNLKDLNVFSGEEYATVWRPELLYTNKEVNLLTHEVNLEPRILVVRNGSAASKLSTMADMYNERVYEGAANSLRWGTEIRSS